MNKNVIRIGAKIVLKMVNCWLQNDRFLKATTHTVKPCSLCNKNLPTFWKNSYIGTMSNFTSFQIISLWAGVYTRAKQIFYN